MSTEHDADLEGRARGGFARAQALTPEKRHDIAKKGAAARWGARPPGALPVAEHRGKLELANIVIPCAVLSTEQRVLTENGITYALLGSRSGASKRLKRAAESEGAPLPLFLAPGNLKPFISNELAAGPLIPIVYQDGRRTVVGFDATLLPLACDVWLKARESGALQSQQLTKAQKAEMLMRSLAKVGIIALVDEATGYQEIRDRKALQAILDAYLRQELAAWAKTFPNEFYEHIFRLRGWEWRGRKVNPPQALAQYTKDIVYERLAPGLIEELEKRNPIENGRRKAKHFQWLTEDVGHPALAQHLHAVIVLQRVSTSWAQFKGMLDTSLPKRGTTLRLPIMTWSPDPNEP